MAALLMFVGIGIFIALTSYLSTAFIKRRYQQDEDELNLAARLDAIEAQLQTIQKLLQEKEKSE